MKASLLENKTEAICAIGFGMAGIAAIGCACARLWRSKRMHCQVPTPMRLHVLRVRAYPTALQAEMRALPTESQRNVLRALDEHLHAHESMLLAQLYRHRPPILQVWPTRSQLEARALAWNSYICEIARDPHHRHHNALHYCIALRGNDLSDGVFSVVKELYGCDEFLSFCGTYHRKYLDTLENIRSLPKCKLDSQERALFHKILDLFDPKTVS